ncbi:uncharacterized protein LOC131947642 [Physella acuta]|uniref:uncharacterized protein LOC131947642 n=1 Tax=Physella acuta TaxID=109671 RepID=UPI0027DDE1E2|nr:uncharacterized protein LOC131947642 [Physella acuta]
MKLQIVFLMLPAIIVCQAFDIQGLMRTVFEILDANLDGHISRGEVSQFFQNHDENYDGVIEKNEFIDAVNAHTVNTDPAMIPLYYNLFPSLDIDSDGFVDHHDIDQIFLHADADKNQQVTEAEFESYFMQLILTHIG